MFQSSGYREMVSEIKAKGEAEKRAAVRKAKEERKRMRREKGQFYRRDVFKYRGR